MYKYTSTWIPLLKTFFFCQQMAFLLFCSDLALLIFPKLLVDFQRPNLIFLWNGQLFNPFPLVFTNLSSKKLAAEVQEQFDYMIG